MVVTVINMKHFTRKRGQIRVAGDELLELVMLSQPLGALAALHFVSHKLLLALLIVLGNVEDGGVFKVPLLKVVH